MFTGTPLERNPSDTGQCGTGFTRSVTVRSGEVAYGYARFQVVVLTWIEVTAGSLREDFTAVK